MRETAPIDTANPTDATLGPLGLRPLDPRFSGAFLSVMALAAGLRLIGIGEWSLWEDEGGAVFWAQRPWNGFAGYFPVFFLGFNGWEQVVGLDVAWGRVLPMIFGLLSIAITVLGFRRHIGAPAALLGGLFLAVNLGHIFFSQSIRYYTMALVFQSLSLYWFFDGLERDRPRVLLLAAVTFVLGLLTHFSVLLLAPVFVGYLLVMIVFPTLAPPAKCGYRRRNYALVFGVLAAVLAFFTWRMMQLREMFEGIGAVIPSARDPIHIGKTIVAYFGLPLCMLAAATPFVVRSVPGRTRTLLVIGTFVPLAELIVISMLNIVNVTWYYAFVAMVPMALAAGLVITDLVSRERRAVAGFVLTCAFVYYAAFLVGYYSIMHGDRPRWKEAVAFLQDEGVTLGEADSPTVYAEVPQVVAFYMGHDPGKWGYTELAEPFPYDVPPSETNPNGDWFVIEAKLVPQAYQSWFESCCTLRARFEAATGPIDRTVLVYQRKDEG